MTGHPLLRAVRRVGTVAAVLAGGWLVLFHAALLYRRVADSSIAEPGVLARWTTSAILVAAAVAFRRQAAQAGRSGPAGVAFWLIVLLLHLSIPADQTLLDYDRHFAAILEAGLALVPALLPVVTLAIGSMLIVHSSRRIVTSLPRRKVELFRILQGPRPPPAV
jgi:hypothetical protein